LFRDQPLDKDAPAAPTATVDGSTIQISGKFRASGTRECTLRSPSSPLRTR
jgi:hypothetical protein